MDLQATMMNNTGGAFQAAGNLPFNIAEIWPFPNLNRDHLIPLNDPMVVDQRTNHGGRLAKKQREDDELAQGVSTSGNGLSESDSKRLKATGSNENEESRGDGEGNSIEQPAKPVEAHKDYIHVRARRGQATDSHSLAERARREKIGERMKTLQDLVPGCNKVIGKALVLDEIINYVQSLQRQVEFLSMKIEAVNSKVTPSIEGFQTKDFGQQTFEPNAMAYGSQATREYVGATSPDWLHMQIGGGFERT